MKLAQYQAWGRFYRVSGILLILGLLGGLGNIAIFAAYPAPGTGLGDTLEYTANNQSVYWVGIALFVALPLLLLPAVVAIYLALRSLDQATVLLATVFGMAGILVLVSLLPAIFSLSVLGTGYATAANEAQRAAYLATGRLVLSEITSGFVISSFLLGVWTFISGGIMTRGVFGKRLGWLGMVSGIGFVGMGVNIVFPTSGLDFVDALAILWIVWLFGVGYKLFRLRAPT